jgi:hypothetical protein
LCQKQTFCAAVKTSLFDYLVGGGEQRLWDGQTKRFGGPEVDYQLKLSRLLHGTMSALPTKADIGNGTCIAFDAATRSAAPRLCKVCGERLQIIQARDLSYGATCSLAHTMRDDQSYRPS